MSYFRPFFSDSSILENAEVLLADVKTKLRQYTDSVQDFAIIRISEMCYAVKTSATNMSCLNFVHVTRKGNPPAFVFSFGSRCYRVVVTVAKKTRTFSRCPHESFANMMDGDFSDENSESDQEQKTATISEASGSEKPDNKWLTNTSCYRFENQRMILSETNLKQIEQEIQRLNKMDGFPALYQVFI